MASKLVIRPNLVDKKVIEFVTEEETVEVDGQFIVKKIERGYEKTIKVEKVTAEKVELSAAEESEFRAGQAAPEDRILSLVSSKLKEIFDEYEKSLSGIIGGYPPSEVDSWPVQFQEAEKYTAQGNSDGLVVIPSMAQARGVDIDWLVNRISSKAGQFSNAYGAVLGERQRRQDLLAAIDLEASDALEQIEAV